MHTGDLGVVQYLAGSVLDELSEEWPGPLTQIGKVDQVWRAIKGKYDVCGTGNRLSHLKREMFLRKDDFPSLKAKAAESRALLFVLQAICDDLHDGSDRDQHRSRCLHCICEVYTIFQREDIFLSGDDHASALRLYETFLLHYHWLLKKVLVEWCPPLWASFQVPQYVAYRGTIEMAEPCAHMVLRL